eukprot:TRINITY_DN47557_c0_g1_i1.p2 TRINITY_DN47557_c0_g1~~TRINITY_DN47557_c0_g1_i1.p2  ORF type:complete len:174 (+),score=60.81 TRINITY_DN47557_c0_g1_i1:66-524(+)
MATSLSDDQIKEAFDLFDVDGSGSIEGAEMMNAMKGLGLKGVTRAEVSEALNAVDSDGNKRIEYEEFAQHVRKKMLEKDSDAEIEAMFMKFHPEKGRGGQDVITLAGMKKVQAQLGEATPDALLEEFLREAGKDGEVTLAQWKRVMYDMKGK